VGRFSAFLILNARNSQLIAIKISKIFLLLFATVVFLCIFGEY